MKKSFNSLTLNLTDYCNLNCTWCYHQSNADSDLSSSLFDTFYDNVIANHIDNIILIGGEPTVATSFLHIVKKLFQKNICIYTNGFIFQNTEFMSKFAKCINPNKVTIVVSLKGFNEQSFRTTTATNYFEKMCLAINQLQKLGLPTLFSYSYDSYMSEDSRNEFLIFLRQFNIHDIIINDLRPYCIDNSIIIHPPKVNGMESLIEFLESRSINTYVRLNMILCNYNKEFINRLQNENKLIVQCAVKNGGGLFFSPNLELLLCNGTNTVIGKFGKDFQDYSELLNYLSTETIAAIYDKLLGYPSSKCTTCHYWKICGGSCILHWI